MLRITLGYDAFFYIYTHGVIITTSEPTECSKDVRRKTRTFELPSEQSLPSILHFNV
jgi:hypothetical protein